MQKFALPLLLATALTVAAPVAAQTDFGDIVSGIAQSLLAQEMDRNAYLEAQRLNTANAYHNYLAKYPKGAFRVNAEQALARLGVPVKPGNPPPVVDTGQSAAAVEASLGLSRAQRIQIQQQLTLIGYKPGVADGLWGSNTRKAISQWQTANKQPTTGYVTAPQVKLIAKQAGPAVVPDPGGTVTVDDPLEERLLGLTYDERRDVQRRLTLLGYNTNGIDGDFGPGTRRALALWQRGEGLRVSGYLTADQLRELRRQTGG